MSGVKAAVAKFREFHGRRPDRATKIDLPFPRSVVFLGEAVAVEYRSDKLALGSRKTRTYRHKFGRGVKIYADPEGSTLYVKGGRFKVTDWMRY